MKTNARAACSVDEDQEHSRLLARVASLEKEIAESKKAEAEVRELNTRLEQRVSECTAELRTANAELESFLYSISHDLRAPLRHINGYVELLKSCVGPDLSEKPGHYLNEIVGSADQVVRLVDDLHSHSRLGRAELRLSHQDLNEIAQTAFSGLRSETKDRNIQWKWGALPQLQVDPALMLQVFINLLSNAIKFTRPRNPGEIEIGSLMGSGNETVVFVRDNGVGFDMEHAGKLFGVFQKLHLRENFEGTGIGLANVRRIIGRHGGRTWAEGQVGKGATFYFSLPTTGGA